MAGPYRLVLFVSPGLSVGRVYGIPPHYFLLSMEPRPSVLLQLWLESWLWEVYNSGWRRDGPTGPILTLIGGNDPWRPVPPGGPGGRLPTLPGKEAP